MAGIERTATGVWRGDLKGGKGEMSGASDVLKGAPFSFATRFENAAGTNPEELIAAAHAGCFSMALSNYLAEQGHTPEEIQTRATITLEGGAISKMHLTVEGLVPGMEADAFRQAVTEADQKCPVSNLLRGGLTISHEATLR